MCIHIFFKKASIVFAFIECFLLRKLFVIFLENTWTSTIDKLSL